MSAVKLSIVSAVQHWTAPRYASGESQAVFIPGVGHGFHSDNLSGICCGGRIIGTWADGHAWPPEWSMRALRKYDARARYLIGQACNAWSAVVMRHGLGTMTVNFSANVAHVERRGEPAERVASIDGGWSTVAGLSEVKSRRIIEGAILAGLCPDCWGVGCPRCHNGWVSVARRIVRLASANVLVPEGWR